MARKTVPPIDLSPQQLEDLEEGLAILTTLGDEIEKARHCGQPGMDDCETVRQGMIQRLEAYRASYGPQASPKPAKTGKR